VSDRRRNSLVLTLVAALVVISLLVTIPIAGVTKPRKTLLGLDLKGGVELIFQGRASGSSPVNSTTIGDAINIITARVNTLGVSNASITSSGSNEIDVSLAGVKNAAQAEAEVGTTAQLYFYDWEESVIGANGKIAGPTGTAATCDSSSAGSGTSSCAVSEYDAVIRAAKQPETPESAMLPYKLESAPYGTYYYVDDKTQTVLTPAGETAPTRAEAVGYLNDDIAQSGKKLPAGARVVWVKPGTVVRQAITPTGGVDPTYDFYYVLRDDPAISGKDISSPVEQVDTTTNEPVVEFGFKGAATSIFGKVTDVLAVRGSENSIAGETANYQHFAVTLDTGLVTIPYIDFNQYPTGIDASTGSEISGDFSISSAQQLANLLASGALPITLAVISSQQVSATLGHQALNQGLLAGAAGLLIVALFLILFYRVLGLIAVTALAIYAIYFYALIKLVPITLTLPGIAGLILTIGVAADANVVIFERVKEESRAGRSPANAIAAGYKRGLAAIVDANAVTFMTAFILFMLSQSDVKGFAFTLGIGVLLSLLTAVAATRAILSTMGSTRFVRRPAALGVRKRMHAWRFDFMGKSRWFFTLSGTILAVGAIAIGANGINFGIDFVSGTQIQVTFNHAASTSQLDKVLASIPGKSLQTALTDPVVQQISAKAVGTSAHAVPLANSFQISVKDLSVGQIGSPFDPGTVEYALAHSFGGIKAGEFSSTSVGPSFGKTVADAALVAIIASLLAITAYIALRFEWKYAVPVLIALMHDLMITAGVYALTGRQVTDSTVAALLTILGYSIYDTIIVFDRVRENVKRMQNAAFSQVVNRSMSEVLTRSLATSFCTLLPVIALLLFGGSTLKDFAFALLIGVASGAYSSIFIASPVLTHWKERETVYRRRRARIAAAHGGVVPAYALGGEEARETEITPARRRRPGRLTEAQLPGAGVSPAEFRELVEDLHADRPSPRASKPEPEFDPAADARPEDVVMPKDDRTPRPRGASKSRARSRRHGRNR